MIKKIVFFLFFISVFRLHGQDTLEYKKFGYDKLAIGISPSSIFNNVGAIQFSVDARLTNRIRVSSEIAYIYNSSYSYYTSGYRIRPSIEAILYAGEKKGIQLGAFTLIRNFSQDRKIKVRHPERYNEYIPVKRSKKLLGAGISLSIVSKKPDRIKIETGGGLGIGAITITDEKDIADVREERFFLSLDRVGKYGFPIIYFNFNISYSIMD
jgi:hypothetical protein